MSLCHGVIEYSVTLTEVSLLLLFSGTSYHIVALLFFTDLGWTPPKTVTSWSLGLHFSVISYSISSGKTHTVHTYLLYPFLWPSLMALMTQQVIITMTTPITIVKSSGFLTHLSLLSYHNISVRSVLLLPPPLYIYRN